MFQERIEDSAAFLGFGGASVWGSLCKTAVKIGACNSCGSRSRYLSYMPHARSACSDDSSNIPRTAVTPAAFARGSWNGTTTSVVKKRPEAPTMA